ncbi:MAG TPA: hypothetical protein VN444_03505 [Verrucomicrobiae bacterium]|nr:hypothetical protein [Verrucomicrobiae bacterium]
MARALMDKTEAQQLANHTVFSGVKPGSICTRCGGLMVDDFYMDILNNVGEPKFAAQRCVQCGEVVDPVILRNRGTKLEPVTAQAAWKMTPSNHVTNVHDRFALQTHGTGFRCARGLESQAPQK